MNELSKEATTWGMLTHLAALAGFLPFGHLLGPFIVWMLKKDEIPFVNEQGKESLNFQITLTICLIVLTITIVGLVLVPFVALTGIILVIIATVKAANGEHYRYPFTHRFIK